MYELRCKKRNGTPTEDATLKRLQCVSAIEHQRIQQKLGVKNARPMFRIEQSILVCQSGFNNVYGFCPQGSK
jgi:hypothetical protein